MINPINNNPREVNHSPENHYEKVVSKDLWATLSDENKETFRQQIDYLEKKVLTGKAIKIRVRPGFIKFFSKLTGVSDYKGGAWRGDTIYLGHTSDLFNFQIVQHEGIHVLQQQELGGFIPWLIEIVKESNEYKKTHKNMNGAYDLSTKIATEMEAYVNQLVPGYIENRDEYAFRKYETQKGVELGIRNIADSNYRLDKEILQKKLLESKNYQELQYIQHDIRKLEEVKSIDIENPDILVFNYLGKIVEVTRVIKILENKLRQLEQNSSRFKASSKLRKMIESCKNEIVNENLSYMMEDDFTDIELIRKTIKELEKKCHEYRKTPTCIRIEDKGGDSNPKQHKKDGGLEVRIPTIYPNLNDY